jgi:hypothetical protein
MDKSNAEIPKYSGALLNTVNSPTYSKCGMRKQEQCRIYTKLALIIREEQRHHRPRVSCKQISLKQNLKLTKKKICFTEATF